MEVPGYTEVRELGRGGTGHVMLAVRDSDGQAVAIKHLSARLCEDDGFAARFRAEVQVIRGFDSPFAARLLEYAEEPGDAVIVMELVDGISLGRLLQDEGGIGAEAALAVLKGVLLGLAQAHRHGIVHRDVQPANVIITEEGGGKLVDFGVAAPVRDRTPLTGTPSYLAPERWDGVPAGPAADIYAAAVIFAECLTGRRPFATDDIGALAYQHQHAVPSMEGVDEPVRRLLRRGLAKDPAARPESAEAFLAELERIAADAYGAGWEARGRSRLGALTVPFLAFRPLAPPVPDAEAAPFVVTPATKLAVTGGLVLATAVAVVSVFLMWNETAQPDHSASPPAPSAISSAPMPTGPPPRSGSPSPRDLGTATPSVPFTRGPGGRPTLPITAAPTRAPDDLDPTAIRSRDDLDPTATRESTPTSEPTSGPTRESTAAEPPGRAKTTFTRSARPGPAESPTTQAPDPRPIISLSIGVSLGVPLLGGEGDGEGAGAGDGLLETGFGLDLGTGLLGLAVLPGSMLLGRHLVVRRTRRSGGRTR